MARRHQIPTDIARQVLTEAGYMCGNPACRNSLSLQLHHILWVKDGGGNSAANLIALCGACHDKHTYGHIPQDAIGVWKLQLQALNDALDRDSIDLLIFLSDRERHDGFAVSGDGILRFARLINGGFVDPNLKVITYGSIGGHPYGLYRPALTARGRELLNSWLTGDLPSFRSTLIGDDTTSTD